MKLYNTLTKNIEEIKPLKSPLVTMYTCGPTVYDYPHIGNWFTFIRYDLLVRVMKATGNTPKWVLNITDVGHLTSDADEGEDKLEKGAKREGKSAWEVAKFYTEYFLKGVERLTITKPDHTPKATDHIQEQIDFIKVLEKKGYTYIIDDGVYYDTKKFAHYADFAQLELDEQQAGTRVAINTQKHNPSDFALWKFSLPKSHRDMEWDSPWGIGFPGWHIECSAMALKYLGKTIDIHAGGIDHIPVHHTNEIAQSEAANEQQFAKYWMHTNHILIDNDKISKSLGNTLTLEDIEKQGYTLADFRLLVLQSHYRSQSKFSWDDLKATQSRMQRWKLITDLRWQVLQTAQSTEKNHPHTVKSAMFLKRFHDALENDLDTPSALLAIEEMMHLIENESLTSYALQNFINLLQAIRDMLGLDLFLDDINDEQKHLINEREKARERRDWEAADRLRSQLEKQGVGLKDTDQGIKWFHNSSSH